jgi:hypothetical protein
VNFTLFNQSSDTVLESFGDLAADACFLLVSSYSEMFLPVLAAGRTHYSETLESASIATAGRAQEMTKIMLKTP